MKNFKLLFLYTELSGWNWFTPLELLTADFNHMADVRKKSELLCFNFNTHITRIFQNSTVQCQHG